MRTNSLFYAALPLTFFFLIIEFGSAQRRRVFKFKYVKMCFIKA
jgi:hypothetical protein